MKYFESQGCQFKSIESELGKLFFRGQANLTWEQVLSEMDKGDFPVSLRGNFAFIYEGRSETIAAVDHVATYPLFYSQENIGGIYTDVEDELKSRTRCDEFFIEQKFLGGFCFSNRAPVKEVLRLRPGHYLKDGKQIQYIDLLSIAGDYDLDSEKYVELVERAITSRMGEKNTLLLSGGTDSTAICGIVKKLNLQDQFRFVSMYSDIQAMLERPTVQKIGDHIGVEVEFHPVPTTSPEELPSQVYRRTYGFWQELSFSAKRTALLEMDLEDCTVFTGEAGDQLFGGPKLAHHLPFASQALHWDEYSIAKQFVFLAMTSNRRPSVYENVKAENIMMSDSKLGAAVYEELIESLAQVFRSCESKDLLNRLLNINLVVKGPYRIFNYSQDLVEYQHPFIDWEVVEYSLGLKSRHKIARNGTLKNIYLTAWSDVLPHDVWDLPKIGANIPDKRLLKE